MKKAEDVETAQSSEPTSKTKKNTRSVHFVGKYV
jgi:hypothetical protein